MVSDQEGTSTVDDSLSGGDSDATKAPKSRWLARERRRQTLLCLCFVTSLFVIAAWWYGYFQMSVVPSAQVDPPAVRFEKLYEANLQGDRSKLHLEGFTVDDRMVLRIGELKSLKTLIIDEGTVTDETIDSIAKLPKLRQLRLRLSPIGDAGFQKLSSCESLWFLNLPHAACTSEGVASLKSLTKLRQLRLGSKNLDNEVANALTQIRSLRGIHLIGVPVTDEGLKKIAVMPYLESLYLDDSAVTEAGWAWLFREHPHLHVHIDQYHHDRDSKAHDHRN
ncbi:MAG: hypothetical protein CBE43_01400 [Rhodopirellula sp. TMED283]|nr:MAG: hypothetical protein CBE43_01400 [Rhodopirellula sp. TMED283]